MLAAAPPPLPGPEVAERAAVMNERHRTAKRAQKECSDLYLLLLLHAQVPAAMQRLLLARHRPRLLHGRRPACRLRPQICAPP